MMRLMKEAYDSVPDPDWFAADEEDVVRRHIADEGFILLAECISEEKEQLPNAEAAGFLIVRLPGDAEDNLGRYLELSQQEQKTVAHLESAVVSSGFQGRKLQYRLFFEAEKALEGSQYKYLMATVHPDNIYSLTNMKKLGCEKVAEDIKYGGKPRLVMRKDINR